MKSLCFLALTAAFSAISFGQTGRIEIPNAAQPQLAVATDGRVWLAYGRLHEAPAPAATDHEKHKGHSMPERAGDVFVAYSNDGGATFSPEVKVATVPKLMLGMRRGPRIAVNGARVTVTVIGAELVAFASGDGGRTWSESVMVNDAPQSAREGLHDLAAAPDGQLFVTWLDLRNGKTELWGAGSKDGGRTWAKNEQIYRSPDTTICECCHPTALFDAEGNLAVMWRNAISGTRDMWLAVRPKGAAQFASARKLGEGTWQLNACPMDGGRIIALGRGKFAAVWQRAGEIFYSATEGSETSLGKGKQPVAVPQANGTLVFWQQGTDLVSLRRGAGTEAAKVVADGARFPVVVSRTNGDMVLAFEQGATKEPKVVVQVMR
jgi:hypothetical protein